MQVGAVGPTGGAGGSTEPGEEGPVREPDPDGLTGPTGPAELMTSHKAVISFWFRVPKATIDACRQRYAEWKAEDDALHDAGLYGKTPPPFNGVIPLLTFGWDSLIRNVGIVAVPGGSFNFIGHTWIGGAVCTWVDTGINPVSYTLFQQAFDGKFDYRSDTSYIGVDCRLGEDEDPVTTVPRLIFRIQTREQGETSGATNAQLHQQSIVSTDVNTWEIDTPTGVGDCEWPPGHVEGEFPNDYYWLDPISASTNTITLEPKLLINNEVFLNRPDMYDRATSTAGGAVTADEWHHVLLSFDLTQPCVTAGRMESDPAPDAHGTVESAPKLYVALDFMHLEGEKLSYFWPETGGPNAFLTKTAKLIYDSNVYPVQSPVYNGGGDVKTTTAINEAAGSFSYAPSPVDMSLIGIPSTNVYVDQIRKVELAELQVFTNVVVDTYYEKRRQAFIDYPPGVEPKYLKDAEGKPILDPSTAEPTRDAKGRPVIDSETGRPVPDMATAKPHKDPRGMAPAPLSRAASLLKKKPEVLLHMSKNWKIGKNTGSMGIDSQGNVLPAGQFGPTGQIKTWKPDPKVGETVGKTADS